MKQFTDLPTDRRVEGLDAWMAGLGADDLPALHGFVHALHRDLPAVVAGLTLTDGNGPIEGANTKVELSKQQMYGRGASPSYANESRSRNDPTTVYEPEPFV